MSFRSSLRRQVPPESHRTLPPESKRKAKRSAGTLDPVLGASEIRLIKLKAGEAHESIAIDMESFDLNNDSTPDVCALSYPWKAGVYSLDGPHNSPAFVSHNGAVYEISVEIFTSPGASSVAQKLISGSGLTSLASAKKIRRKRVVKFL